MVKRGRKVADVAERLGVSSHILYRWVKAAQPDDSDARRAALVEARSCCFARKTDPGFAFKNDPPG